MPCVCCSYSYNFKLVDAFLISSNITVTGVDIWCGRVLRHGQQDSYTVAGPACGWGSAKFPAREGEAAKPMVLDGSGWCWVERFALPFGHFWTSCLAHLGT